jgi:predicted Ser/Thr protein kinase
MKDFSLGFAGRRLTVKQEFFSIKNRVYLIQDTDDEEKVLKIFRDRSVLEKEKENLKRFSPISPRVLDESEESLLLEYIPGRNLLDIYVQLEADGGDAGALLEQIASVLERLYVLSPGYRLGDINLRNFILEDKSGLLRFVDFEEACLGQTEEDVGRMLAFLLTYRPVDTEWKRDFVIRLAERLIQSGQDAGLIHHYAEDELEAIAKRRSIPLVKLPEGLRAKFLRFC